MKPNTQHLYSKLKEFVSEYDRMPSIRELQSYVWYKSTRSISLIYNELLELWMLEKKWTKYYLTWMEYEELVSKKQIKEIAHNIRNKSNNTTIKQKRIYQSQQVNFLNQFAM